MKDASVDASSTANAATTEEEDVVAGAGTTVALAKGGVTDLVRITGRTSLAREAGEISLVRIARQEGMKTNIKTRGLGASRSRELSPASWAELRPQPRSASSNSLLVK